MLQQASCIVLYAWASAAEEEEQRWFLYHPAYSDPGMDPPSYMQNTDSPFQQESLQILSADEMGASSFFTFFAPANTADTGCEQSIKSPSILQSFLLCVRTDKVGSTTSQQQ